MSQTYDLPNSREVSLATTFLDTLHDVGLGDGPMAEAVANLLPPGTKGEFFTIVERD